MRNKIIFGLLALAVFAISAIGGYFGPTYLKDRRQEIVIASFTVPAVPKAVTEQFARHFSAVDVATEAKFLPDVPFVDIKGKAHKISDFSARPTLVNLWATWCTPCIVELPSLQKLSEYYEGRLDVVAIALEDGTTPGKISSFLEKRELSEFAGYLDLSGDFSKNLQIRGIPTSFLIGIDGLILYRFEGDADWASEDSRAFFDVFLLQKR